MIHRFVDVFEGRVCSPPWAAYGGAATSGDPQVFVACSSDAPGEATAYTNFTGFVDADQCHNPVLSPDGTQVLFEVESPSTGYREIWVVDAVGGSTPTQLVSNGSQYCFHPAWGADSDTFVYVLGAGGAIDNGSIYKDTVSAPGSPTLLRAPTGGAGCFRPQFNFDGTRVAYIYTASGDPQLRCMDDDGTNDGLVDNTLSVYDSNQPPQFSWANTQNLIAFQDGQPGALVFVIDDTGGGKIQINASGDAASFPCYITGYGYAWPADDSFVVITANLGAGFYNIIRCELDGSDTNVLGTTGANDGNSYFRGALVYQGRIWFISDNVPTKISSMTLTGTDETVNLDASLGSGDMVEDLGGGDGWYFV